MSLHISTAKTTGGSRFSELKLGYRGDLRFSQVEVFEMTEVMGIAPTQEQDTTFPNLTM